MPDQAYTVTPVYSDQDGSYQDSVVSHTHSGGRTDANDYFENEHGELQYQYMPPDNFQDPDSTHWDTDEYLTDLVDAIPNLPDVIQYAATADDIPAEYTEEWNAMLENGIDDMDRFYELLEMFVDSYEASGGELEDPTSDEYQWFNDNLDAIQQELDIVQDTQYTYEQADQMASLAAHYQHGSAEQAILKAGIDLAFDKQTFEEAFDQITSRFGQAAAAKAYYAIKQQLETP